MYLKKNNKGASFLEFAIAVPILCVVVLGMIDLFSYLYLSNILEARAHRALEVASWVPSLSENRLEEDGEGGPNLNNEKFTEAVDKIINSALEGEMSSLFSTEVAGQKRAKLKNGDDVVLEKYIDSTDSANSNFFEGTENNRIAIILPQVDTATKNRDIGFSRQPIGIRINADIKPFSPFLPTIKIKGEAWGFREDYSSASTLPMFDCTGKPYNPNDLPDPEVDCNCQGGGINPLTGQCGCPAGKTWGIKPGGTTPQCICDINLIYKKDASGNVLYDGNSQPIKCSDGQLIDYDNCECGATCPLGEDPKMGQRRDEDNACSCKSTLHFAGPPPGLAEVSPGVLITDPSTIKNGCNYTPQECEQNIGPAVDGGYSADSTVKRYYDCSYKAECATTDACPANSKFNKGLCGCYCNTGGNHLVNPNDSCPVPPPCNWHVEETTGYSLIPWLQYVCDHYTCEDWTVLYGNKAEVVGAGCQNTYNGLASIPAGCKCQCKAGFYRNSIACCKIGECQDYNTGDVRAEKPTEYTYVGQNKNGHKSCICACKDGFIKDQNTNECVAPDGTDDEGING